MCFPAREQQTVLALSKHDVLVLCWCIVVDWRSTRIVLALCGHSAHILQASQGPRSSGDAAGSSSARRESGCGPGARRARPAPEPRRAPAEFWAAGDPAWGRRARTRQGAGGVVGRGSGAPGRRGAGPAEKRPGAPRRERSRLGVRPDLPEHCLLLILRCFSLSFYGYL